jgi:hypothetical protein
MTPSHLRRFMFMMTSHGVPAAAAGACEAARVLAWTIARRRSDAVA